MSTVPPRLVAVWSLLFVLLAAIAALELHEPAAGRAAPEEPVWLLPAPLEQIGAVEIGHAGRLHRFERDAAGSWLRHAPHRHGSKPHAHKAGGGAGQRVGDVLAAFARTRIERRMPYEPKAGPYGLGTPSTVVVVYPRAGGDPLARYAIGDLAPDTFSRYVHQAGSPEVVTIPNYQVENLLSLLR